MAGTRRNATPAGSRLPRDDLRLQRVAVAASVPEEFGDLDAIASGRNRWADLPHAGLGEGQERGEGEAGEEQAAAHGGLGANEARSLASASLQSTTAPEGAVAFAAIGGAGGNRSKSATSLCEGAYFLT